MNLQAFGSEEEDTKEVISPAFTPFRDGSGGPSHPKVPRMEIPPDK